MKQNIFEICNNNIVYCNKNINEIYSRHCDNIHCVEYLINLHRVKKKICRKCGSFICNRCISNNHDKCVVCSFPNIKLSEYKRCKNCCGYIKKYICKICNKLVLHCDGYCEYSMFSLGSLKLVGYCCKNCNDYDNLLTKFIKYNEIEYQ